jgi:hypothetical protein
LQEVPRRGGSASGISMETERMQGGRIVRWAGLSAVTAFLGGLPALIAAFIFGTVIRKPLLDAVVPVEMVRFQASLAERLLLTGPLTLAVALFAFLCVAKFVEDWPTRLLTGSALLVSTSWLGKALSYGLAADFTAPRGKFVVVGNRLVWEADTLGMASNVLAGSIWTKGIALLLNYYRLYGPEQFLLSLICGAFLGSYWAWKIRDPY